MHSMAHETLVADWTIIMTTKPELAFLCPHTSPSPSPPSSSADQPAQELKQHTDTLTKDKKYWCCDIQLCTLVQYTCTCISGILNYIPCTWTWLWYCSSLFRVSAWSRSRGKAPGYVTIQTESFCDNLNWIMHLRATACLHCHCTDNWPARHRIVISHVAEVRAM